VKIYLTDQGSRLREHLDHLKLLPVMVYDKSVLRESTSSITINTPRSLEFLDTTSLSGYRIFPENIMTALTEWGVNGRSMQVGDTIVQQVYIPPIRSFSQKVVFGVRISEIIDEPNRKGFSYETLKGHVEKGVSSFMVEQTAHGIVFGIHTFSGPGNFLTRLVAPIFSIPYQAYCRRRALEHVKDQLDESH
jgi:uncharacterized protein (UPF0548 family)